MKLRSLITAFAFTAAATASAQAAPQGGTEYLTGTLGWYDVTQQDNEALLFGAEYRFAPSSIFGIRPDVGAFVTTDSSAYVYFGLSRDFAITDNVYIVPNLAAGAYTAGDDGKRLGGAIEFRSGIEVQYEMQNDHRVGLAFNHMSNASIYRKNPGVETLLLTYSVPTGRIFY